METSNFPPGMHIAQQSRRERLRIQQQLKHPSQNVEVYTHTSEQITSHDGLNPDLVQLQRLRYGNLVHDPSTSELVNFQTGSQALLAHSKDVHMLRQEPSSSQSEKQIASNLSGDLQNCSTWKGIGSNENRDWATSCTSGSAGMEGNPHMKSNWYDYQHVTSSLTRPSNEMPSQVGQKHFGEVQLSCPSVYQTVTYDLGTASFAQENTREPCHLSWSSTSNALHLNSRGIGEEVDARGLRNVANENPNTQGLVLSLSPVPLRKQNQCGMDERIASENFNARGGYLENVVCSTALMSDHASLCSKPSNSTSGQRCVAGPLGPFTGYAMILKASKFLNPAQQLLHEICGCANPKDLRISEKNVWHSGNDVNPMESEGGGALDWNSGGSTSNFCHSNAETQEFAGSCSPNDSCRPEFLQKKAKLLYMQEEVCRRYKQYHQQMQMVVSSFEAVAGLSAATPYVSVALKTISRLFRLLKNAISDRLKNLRKALGEDLSSLTTGAGCSKSDTSSSRHKLIDQAYTKAKAVGSNLGLFDPQQPVWRPQRGLPERAVAILRAWLFDHFLHPYPTDSDKHMLASQTGLTRNQVSNWFINARVRIWKPMVEEIHSLEAKGTAETGSNVGKSDGKESTENGSCSNDGPPLNMTPAIGLSGRQVEFPEIGASALPGIPMNAQSWNQDGSIGDFAPYRRTGIDLGGVGAVSLTLGLRQDVAASGQPQQAGDQLRRHFGDHIVYDFVG